MDNSNIQVGFVQYEILLAHFFLYCKVTDVSIDYPMMKAASSGGSSIRGGDDASSWWMEISREKRNYGCPSIFFYHASILINKQIIISLL